MNLLETFWQYSISALTVFKEARGEPYPGKVGVARVIRNRAEDRSPQWPNTLDGVCLQPMQFSCWNKSDPNLGLVPRRGTTEWDAFEECMRAVLEAEYNDPTGGATHYVNLRVASPAWALRLRRTAEIGNHTFLK